MNKPFSAFLLLFFVSFATLAQRSNCGVNPQHNTQVQADGSSITLYPYGNEAISYLETSSGYTVLFNKSTGNYEYATPDASGNLTLSGAVASDAADRNMQKTSLLTPHLRYSAAQQSVLMQYFQQQAAMEQEMGKAGANVFPSAGDRKVLILMVQYTDLPATIPTSNFEVLLNQDNHPTGSFRDYYMQATKGRLRINCDVYGWFTSDSGYKYYGKTSSPSYGSATRKLLLGAINDADSVVDFSQYDSDSDGYVDAVILIHSGIGAEEQSAPNYGNYIHSFRSTLGSTQTPTKDGKKFSAYCMFPEKLYNGGSNIIVGIGVIAHEFGHILDLPDLYSTQYNNAGCGNYTIMAAGTWLNYQKTPSILDAWSRYAMNWGTTVTITDIGTYTIPKAVADSNFAYRINTKKSNEFFLLENRQNKGFDKFVPSKGLAVWQINTNYAGRLSQSGNNVNNDTANLGVHLLQADGNREMERNINNGNAGDLFPGTTNNKNITPFTKPSTNHQVTYASSNIFITNITLNPDSSITFKFSSQPAAAFTPSRISGCAPLSISLENSSTSASSFKWDFGNGQISTTELNPELVYENPGTYVVTLTVYDTLGVASDSFSSNIQVYPSPTASFSLVQIGNKLSATNTSSGTSFIQWQYNIGSTSYTSSSESLNDVTVPDSGMFRYKLVAFNNYGCADTAYGETYAFPTALEENQPQYTGLDVYPNPYTGDLKLSVQLSRNMPMRFTLFNLIGEEVANIPEQLYLAGKQTLLLDAFTHQKPGVYFLQMELGGEKKTIRVIKAE
ncbi:MAG: M6 family metalloprotease domain-containing protein [Bacteroidia bacterium]|jgi:M6 family metalloprotease-like protein